MEMNLIPAGITGTGMGVPDRVVTNSDLEKIVDTSDEWIITRSGIKQRRIVEPGVYTSDLAVKAAREALAQAGLAAEDLDAIIIGTVTADYPFPAAACVVQEKLGAHRATAFDLSAGCTGFMFALTTAAQYINTGMYRNILVIGADTLSRVVNWEDRTTCVLFGDGAGAVVLQPVSPGKGILACDLGSDGTGVPLLLQTAGGSRYPACAETISQKQHTISMSGKEVFKFAVKVMGEASEKAIAKAGLTIADIDYFIPHQANIRIIDAAVKRLGLDKDKVFVNVDRYGNTSSASIGIALTEAVQEGKIKDGDTIVLVGFGAGLTWGACVVRWGR